MALNMHKCMCVDRMIIMRSKLELKDEDYLTIERLSRSGINIESIAANLGFSKATLDRRLSEDLKAKQALERGRTKAIEAVSNTAFEMATSGKHPSMTMFWLKSRAGWRDKDSNESSQNQNIEIVIDAEDAKL